MNYKNLKVMPLVFLVSLFSASPATANSTLNESFDFWADDNWSEFSYETNTNNLLNGKPDGIINPGGGGQAFDTENLFYKYNADTNEMSVGIQTGFDVVDGHVRYNSRDYYSGDLALSFDGDVILGDRNEGSDSLHRTLSSYEYAVDFGLYTENRDGESVESRDSNGGLNNGIDHAGLYRVSRWDNDISSTSSSPFAMDWSDDELYSVQLITDENNRSGAGWLDRTETSGQNYSYWRTVTFSLDGIISEGDAFTVDAHWTMSCGNDNINGTTQLVRNSTQPVPEPSVLALFTIGSLGMGFFGLRRRKMTAKFIA